MRTCFVSLPFGSKTDQHGRSIDFGRLYLDAVSPVLEEADLTVFRPGDLAPGTDWQRTLLRQLISSDLVVADVSLPAGNILYELGIRHALRPGGTVLIASRTSVSPFDAAYVRTILYDIGGTDHLTDQAAETFRSALKSAVHALLETAVVTSPVFQLFPDLDVSLPPELVLRPRSRRARSTPGERSFAQRVILEPERAVLEVAGSEAAVRLDDSADPFEYLSLLRKYRDLAEWDRVVRLAEEAPPVVAESAETRRMLALALNRRNQTGDRDRAFSIMEQVVTANPTDGESQGVLGLICKERYEAARDQEHPGAAADARVRALDAYRQAFRINPKDFYSGMNVINLLLEQPDDPQAREEIRDLLPKVRSAVQVTGPGSGAGIRELSTELQLAAIAGDWNRAEFVAQQIVEQDTPDWMVKSTVRDLQHLNVKLPNLQDQRYVAGLTEKLQASMLKKLAL